MSEPFIGDIRAFATGFTPKGWLECDGRLLSLEGNDNSFGPLYRVIGTTYGSTSPTNFRIPDLRGRVIVGAGMTEQYAPGAVMGTATTEITAAPRHTHRFNIVNRHGDEHDPEDNMLAASIAGPSLTRSVGLFSTQENTSLHPETLEAVGTSKPNIPNMQPYTALTYCIAYEGDYPIPP